jgi:hypothetical protein
VSFVDESVLRQLAFNPKQETVFLQMQPESVFQQMNASLLALSPREQTVLAREPVLQQLVSDLSRNSPPDASQAAIRHFSPESIWNTELAIDQQLAKQNRSFYKHVLRPMLSRSVAPTEKLYDFVCMELKTV